MYGPRKSLRSKFRPNPQWIRSMGVWRRPFRICDSYQNLMNCIIICLPCNRSKINSIHALFMVRALLITTTNVTNATNYGITMLLNYSHWNRLMEIFQRFNEQITWTSNRAYMQAENVPDQTTRCTFGSETLIWRTNVQFSAESLPLNR